MDLKRRSIPVAEKARQIPKGYQLWLPNCRRVGRQRYAIGMGCAATAVACSGVTSTQGRRSRYAPICASTATAP
jgi:hypothetical protein